MGSKKDAFYRIVVSDSRVTPRGPFLETLGTYDPGTEPATVKLELAKIQEWIRKGAHPSETVRSLVVQAQRAES